MVIDRAIAQWQEGGVPNLQGLQDATADDAQAAVPATPPVALGNHQLGRLGDSRSARRRPLLLLVQRLVVTALALQPGLSPVRLERRPVESSQEGPGARVSLRLGGVHSKANEIGSYLDPRTKLDERPRGSGRDPMHWPSLAQAASAGAASARPTGTCSRLGTASPQVATERRPLSARVSPAVALAWSPSLTPRGSGRR